MLNKVDKIFIGAAASIPFFYTLPFFALIFTVLISVPFRNINNLSELLLLLGFGCILLISIISIVVCHAAYLVLFWTLYKKIREPQKTKKDYWIIFANVAAIIFYGVLALITWFLIVAGMVVD